jgi:hypothetical protein
VHDLHFPFELLPLEDVQPWGTPESGLSLSWYGLTNGWYDLVVGEQRLFSAPDGDPRGIDYQVARLWEELLAAAPFVLEPLPRALAARARRGDAWARWERDTREAADALGEVAELAVAWWSHRTVGSYHLRGAPDMNLWRDGDDLHVRWRSIPSGADAPVWCSPDGDATVAVQRFCDELARFDRDLIAAMQVRVDAIAAGQLRPDIAIDVAALHAEHADRATWLRSALTIRPGGLPRGDDVTEAVLEAEHRLGWSALDVT